MNPTQQWINKQWWLAGLDFEVEREQARDEGRVMTAIDKEIDRLMAVPLPKGVNGPLGGMRDAKWQADAWKLMDRIQRTPFRKDYPHREPSDLPGIKAARPKAPRLKAWKGDRAEWIHRVHGAWLGRLGGCMLGKPVEFWTRTRIRTQAEVTGNWPLKGYFRWPDAAQTRALKKRDKNALFNPKLPHQVNSTLPGLKGACVDDDINYTVTGYALMKWFGFDTDCNGATAGSLWGMMNGPEGIPSVWTKPLRDQFQSTVEGFQSYSIRKLAVEMVDLATEHAG